MKAWFFKMLSICLFLILCLGISEECPPPESLTPCLCRIEPLSKAREILCYDINNEQTLSNAISAIRKRTDIYGVKIQDSVLNYIPHDTFSDVRIKELEIADSSLSSLSDTDIAFAGLEDHLDNLFFTDCIFMGSWDWEKLKNLRKLLSLEIRGGQFESIESDIKDIGHLDIKIFNFARNKISYIDDEAFAMFKNIISLDLSDNFITEMKRDMLPNPALNLRKIDLSGNQIEILPENMFTEMPNILAIMLKNNRFLSLEEKTFSLVWEQLQNFDASENSLRCDCRISWMVGKRYPKATVAYCAEPPALKGKNLETLASKDLRCL